METLMTADRMVGKILASITGNKEIDMAKEAEIEKKISKYVEKNEEKKMNEYLVRGAVLVCNKGSHKRKINLPKCHGVYIRKFPVLHELECKTECQCGLDQCNVTYFGVCEAELPTEKSNGQEQSKKRRKWNRTENIDDEVILSLQVWWHH